MVKKLVVILLVFAAVTFLAFYFFFGNVFKRVSNIPEIKNISDSAEVFDGESQELPRLSVVAKNLEIPWSLVFLPGGEILFTERPGRVKIVDKSGNLRTEPVAVISEVKNIGEGGLMGIEISPDFEDDGYVFLYYTYSENNGRTLNRVERYTFDGKTLLSPRVIVNAIPGASNHDGGRIKFGPDGFLYITTGDAQEPSLAQDRNSLAGKILRVTEDGNAAPGNSFGTRVFSYGHRNPQGIAWDSDGNLWATEHGRSGAQSGFDELNLIELGKNFGWPEIQGDETRDGMVTPIVNSGPTTTWAPSGAAYFDGSIYFAGLRGAGLYQYDIQSRKLTKHLDGELGRLRAVVAGEDGMLYVTTSNRDGRGLPFGEDDKILRVNPEKL